MGLWGGQDPKDPKSKKSKTSSPKKAKTTSPKMAPKKQASAKPSVTPRPSTKNQSPGTGFGFFGSKPPEAKPKGMFGRFSGKKQAEVKQQGMFSSLWSSGSKPTEAKPKRLFSSLRSNKKGMKQGVAVGSSGRGKKPPTSKPIQKPKTKPKPNEKKDTLVTIGRWLHLPESFMEKRSSSAIVDGTWDMVNYQRFLRDYVIVSLLFFLNTMCYTDNVVLLGATKYIMKFYEIDEKTLLQYSDATIIVTSLSFGVLGDRWNRKWLISIGLTIWTCNNVGSSVVGKDYYYVFITLRLIASMGEVGLRILTNAIIADLFVRPVRLKFYTVFYLAVPIGTGLGYIISAYTSEDRNNWHLGLRFAHPFTMFCLLLLMIIMYEPSRGSSDGAPKVPPSKILRDIKYLITHKTFIHTTMACSCSSFVISIVLLEGPDFIVEISHEQTFEDMLGILFGMVTIFSGVTGLLGAYLVVTKLKNNSQKSEPLVCGIGLMLSAPFLLLFFAYAGTDAGWVFLFFAFSLLNIPLALEINMLMYSVIPNKRSLAGGLHVFITKSMGEIVGSRTILFIRKKLYQEFKDETLYDTHNMSRRFSLYSTCVFVVLGGAFYFFASTTVESDVAATQRNIKGMSAPSSGNVQGSNSVRESSERGRRLEIEI